MQSNYTDILQELGLPKNEARIYETLLEEGESSVGHVAVKSGVHRRNVYDSLARLIEKGLVFEVLQKQENRYQAVDPGKLNEILSFKQEALSQAMPGLQDLYQQGPKTESVYIYRGLEGWKNYLRDILRVGEDTYVLGGKGALADPRVKPFVRQFAKEAVRKKIKFEFLFDHDSKEPALEVFELLGGKYKFLPKGYSSPAMSVVFGDHVVIFTRADRGQVSNEGTFIVVKQPSVAETFRVWFRLMWDLSSKRK